MSTPFVSTYLKVAADDSDRPTNPVENDDFDTSPEMIAFRFEADTQTLIFWDPVNEDYLTVQLGGPGVIDAADVSFDNVASGLTATNVQDAIDELDAAVDGLGSPPATTTDLPEGSNLYYTDERAQDAVGGMLDASLTYVDGTPLLQRAALTGDVTAAAGSNATTIAAAAVTPAKLSYVGCRVSKSVDQTGANYSGAGALIAWTAEDHDDGGWHDNVTANTDLTVPAGVTRAEFGITLVTDSLTAGDLLDLRLYKNGSLYQILASRLTRGSVFSAISVSSGPLTVTAGDDFAFHLTVSADTSITLYATTEGGCHAWAKALG